MDPELYVLIIAGGRGTRFWPRSRRKLPKQCISLDGHATLIQRTLKRVLPLVPAERVLVVTSADMALALFEQLPELPDGNILVEPVGMNTAPAVGWGAMEVAKRSEGANPVMCVLPSDHVIQDEEVLLTTLRAAAKAARATNALVTIGLEPLHPETAYGYLKCGEELGRWDDKPFARVERFVEKPDAETAARYLEDGHYLWNAGMFVFAVDAVRDSFRQHLPNTWAQLERLRHSPHRLEELYPKLDPISIDYGIMERAGHVLTIRADLGWSDVGSWDALREHLPSSAARWGEPDACQHLTWQLLASVAAGGGTVEPLPLTLFDAELGPTPSQQFVPNVVRAGSRTLATERRGGWPRNASARGAWSSDALDLSAVLLVLQGLSRPPDT